MRMLVNRNMHTEIRTLIYFFIHIEIYSIWETFLHLLDRLNLSFSKTLAYSSTYKRTNTQIYTYWYTITDNHMHAPHTHAHTHTHLSVSVCKGFCKYIHAQYMHSLIHSYKHTHIKRFMYLVKMFIFSCWQP